MAIVSSIKNSHLLFSCRMFEICKSITWHLKCTHITLCIQGLPPSLSQPFRLIVAIELHLCYPSLRKESLQHTVRCRYVAAPIKYHGIGNSDPAIIR